MYNFINIDYMIQGKAQYLLLVQNSNLKGFETK